MLLIASFDDFMGPDEEHSGDEISVGLEAGLVAEPFVDFELLLGLGFFLLHYKSLYSFKISQINSHILEDFNIV